MQEGKSSRTAERVAMRRAAHQLYDDPPLVFTDPLALRILPEEARTELREREEMERLQPFARGMRAFMAVRSRFAEDALERAFAAGVRQYVVLGAGLDTYAARSLHDDLRVFEVDHPATQAWKRQRLEESGIPLADTVTFVPVDFEHERLMDRLVASGFDASAPAFCSWLGVLPYLTREAAEGTLRALGGCRAAAEWRLIMPSSAPHFRHSSRRRLTGSRSVWRGRGSPSGWGLCRRICGNSWRSAASRGWRTWTARRSMRDISASARMD